jgi:hypothetical protein
MLKLFDRIPHPGFRQHSACTSGEIPDPGKFRAAHKGKAGKVQEPDFNIGQNFRLTVELAVICSYFHGLLATKAQWPSRILGLAFEGFIHGNKPLPGRCPMSAETMAQGFRRTSRHGGRQCQQCDQRNKYIGNDVYCWLVGK